MAKINYTENDRLYIQMMQNSIERMAANCANCKTWLVTIITAIIALLTVVHIHLLLVATSVPILIFWYLDMHYLSLERGMRNRQRYFINIMGSECQDGYDTALFDFQPLMCEKGDEHTGMVSTSDMWKSFSLWGFYGFITIVVSIIFIMVI